LRTCGRTDLRLAPDSIRGLLAALEQSHPGSRGCACPGRPVLMRAFRQDPCWRGGDGLRTRGRAVPGLAHYSVRGLRAALEQSPSCSRECACRGRPAPSCALRQDPRWIGGDGLHTRRDCSAACTTLSPRVACCTGAVAQMFERVCLSETACSAVCVPPGPLSQGGGACVHADGLVHGLHPTQSAACSPH